ncbi:MAG: hypothetical protein KAT71_06800 [Gammaproteobacteria bacterium]|nr:hypothetical protein [Gammaproteobacteria bacterium]
MLTFFQPACDLIAGHLDSNGLLAVKRVNRQGYYWGSYNWFIHATVSNKRKWLLKYLPHITRNPNCISQRFAEVIINFANDFNTPITLRILCLGAKIFIPNSGANDADLRLLKTFAARETLLPYVCFVMYHSLHATEKESVIEWLKASINEVLEDIGKLCDAFSKSIHFGIEARKYNLQRAENYLSAKQCMTTSVMLYHHLSQEDKIYISEKLLIMFQKDHPRDWVTIPIVMFGMFYATEYNNESSNNYLVKVIQRISIAGALDYGLEEECFNELLFILQKNDPSKIKNIVGPILDSIFDPINKHPSYGLKHLFYRLCPKLPKPVRARCFEQTLVLAESNQSHYESKKYIEYLIKFYMLEDKPEDQELAMRVAELERLCNIVKDGLPVPATPEHIDVQNLVQAVFDGHYTEGGIEGFPQLSRCSDYPPQ